MFRGGSRGARFCARAGEIIAFEWLAKKVLPNAWGKDLKCPECGKAVYCGWGAKTKVCENCGTRLRIITPDEAKNDFWTRGDARIAEVKYVEK